MVGHGGEDSKRGASDMARPNMAAAKRPPNKRQFWTHGFTQCIDVGTRCWMISRQCTSDTSTIAESRKTPPCPQDFASCASPQSFAPRTRRKQRAVQPKAQNNIAPLLDHPCINSTLLPFRHLPPTIAMPPPSTEPHNHPQTNKPMHIQCPLKPNLPHVTHTSPCVHSLLCAVCNKPHMCQGTLGLDIAADPSRLSP